MPTIDNRIDDYIKRAQPFAQPILKQLRAIVHKACPDVVETIKWGFPVFEYKGLLCGFASFKAHCSFNLWKYKLVEDKHGLIEKGERDGMGIFGKIYSLKDLPSEKIMMDYLKQAIELNEKGIKLPAPARNKINPPLIIPNEFKDALDRNKFAKIAFENFSYSHKKEYVEYITEAKQEKTRLSRIEKSIEKLAENKSHNWKYESKKN
ncbi:MAG: hypothetical protein RIQ33_1869 [Bacteroidota bacterium]|jgi:uncharacterized protein YdeI (YjbR/CyaY-like superfamily)